MTCGCLTRHAHDVRGRLGGVSIWRCQWTRGKAVGTVLPPSHQMRPEVPRNAVVAPQGDLSLERLAGIGHLYAG